MKFYIYILLFWIFNPIESIAQTAYPVNTIPLQLKENADAVIRNEEILYEYKGPGSGILKKKIAITILNPNGINAGTFYEDYDRFYSINNLKAIIYDGNGKKIKSIKAVILRMKV